MCRLIGITQNMVYCIKEKQKRNYIAQTSHNVELSLSLSVVRRYTCTIYIQTDKKKFDISSESINSQLKRASTKSLSFFYSIHTCYMNRIYIPIDVLAQV